MNDRLATAILTTKKRDDASRVKTRRIGRLPKSEAALEISLSRHAGTNPCHYLHRFSRGI